MRIHLIKRQSIGKFMQTHSGSERSFSLWLAALSYADWNEPGDILKTFPSAELLGRGTNRVVFDLAGNRYRMICKYLFGAKEAHLFVCWIGTHAAYDKICAKKEQYTINIYS
jgi:mRNA interferase HigB